MGIINNIKDTGFTTYDVNLETLIKLVAQDLNVPVDAVSVEEKTITRSDTFGRDSWEEFAGIKVKVDNSKVTKPAPSLQYPPGVRMNDYKFRDDEPIGQRDFLRQK